MLSLFIIYLVSQKHPHGINEDAGILRDLVFSTRSRYQFLVTGLFLVKVTWNSLTIHKSFIITQR